MTIDEEIHDYRPHRFAIIRLESAPSMFAIFAPSGEFLAQGTFEEISHHILTGPQHYEQTVANWIARPRTNPTTEGLNLLQSLGLAKPMAQPKIERRF